MKKLILYSFLGSLILMAGLVPSDCSAFELNSLAGGKIRGSWKFKDQGNGPQKLTFRKDGTYELDFNSDGKKDIWGSYRISQDWVIMNDVGGDFVFDCGQQGAYSYKIVDDVLTFTIMADQCPSRSQAMSQKWLRLIERNRIIVPPKMLKI